MCSAPHQAQGCFLSWLERTGWEGGARSRWARGVLGSRCLPSRDSVSAASQLGLLGRLRDQRQVRTQSPAWHRARGHFCDRLPASSWRFRVGPQSPGVLHLQALGRVTLSRVVTVLAWRRRHRGRTFPGAAEAPGLQRERTHWAPGPPRSHRQGGRGGTGRGVLMQAQVPNPRLGPLPILWV